LPRLLARNDGRKLARNDTEEGDCHAGWLAMTDESWLARTREEGLPRLLTRNDKGGDTG